ncbi:ADP-forming succinate--CoA ligase subunit beta [Chloroflexota bacterium]
MKLFEFEAKEILRKYGIATPKGSVAGNADEAARLAEEINKPAVLKSQVLVSGRGKAGGILFADNGDAARKAASSLIGSTIKGVVVKSLLVEEKLDIADEFYASVAVDRQAKKYVIMVSTAGGIDIEQVASASPDKITKHYVDPAAGFTKNDANVMTSGFPSINKQDAAKFAHVVSTLYDITLDNDAELVEINPLVKTESGEFVACDARMIVDDYALFRHPEFRDRRFVEIDETPREAEAKKHGMAYVDLDGDIGIVGNGAGLVMVTVDLVHYFGGKPANFLDIGGGAESDIIKRGVMLVMSKPEVKAVLINILGGITRCDIVARGVIDALQETKVKKPVAVRMIGTNEEEGINMLNQNGIQVSSNMEESVQQVLKL